MGTTVFQLLPRYVEPARTYLCVWVCVCVDVCVSRPRLQVKEVMLPVGGRCWYE